MAVVVVLVLATSAFAGFPDDWVKDAGNPISTDFWGTTVIFHEGIYKAWGEAENGVSYATSPDGLVWAIHPASPVLVEGPGWYDQNGVFGPSVVVVDGVYHMFYSCEADIGRERTAHAVSPDGIVWTKDPANPVLDLGPPGSIDSGEVTHPTVIYEEPLFRIWYNCRMDIPGEEPRYVAYATSYDGVTWARYPTPVMEEGAIGEWDNGIAMMNVFLFQGTYYLFYTGIIGDVEGGTATAQIGYATSPDGISWTRRSPSEPVLRMGDAGDWDSVLVGAPVVMETGTGFRMWYAGGVDFENIDWGLATSEYPPRPVHDYGAYFPLYEGAVWNYQSVVNPANTRVESVCCPFEIEEGHPAMIYDLDGGVQLVCWKDGASVIFYGFSEDGVFTDFVPDMVLGSFQDGAIIAYPCDTPPCEQFELVRVWDELDHPDLGEYGIDPGYEDLVVIAHYSGGDDTNPNRQNEIIESNLPAGLVPPPGAVTDLEWRQPGVGAVAMIGVSASTGDLHEKYVLVDISPVSDDDVAGRRLSQLHQNCPNPFNPQTTIAFDLPDEAAVKLAVYDVSGRLVDVLLDGDIVDQGRNEVVWRGRDMEGGVVSSGVYFYRLDAGAYSETKRMTLVK